MVATTLIKTPQAYMLAPFNVPAKHMRATTVPVQTVVHVNDVMKVTQVAKLAVVKGRVATPEIRAFTYTEDGHEFYVLRLGDRGTLVYDIATQEWLDYTSPSLVFWRLNVGRNWRGAGSLAYQYGSNVVVGDDTYGLLYFLDPNQPYDIHPDYTNADQQIPFERIVMAQAQVSGRNFVPCYFLSLDGDNYGLENVDFTPAVTLDYSDDQGQNFVTAGTITMDPNTQNQDYRWYSLGQMQSPGRLFRVTDNGLLARIDALGMNDDG
jgi:hypothetical protein